MKSYSESHGIATFKALPHPLPESVQNIFKESAKRLFMLREDITRAPNKVIRAQAVEDYNNALLDFDAQEELLRNSIGVIIMRPVFKSIAPLPAFDQYAA